MSISRASGVPFSDKLRFGWQAVKQHRFLLSLMSLFFLIGLGIIWIASATDVAWFLYGFGGFFCLFALVFIAVTIPSSLIHSYEKQVIAKYGRKDEGVVTDTYVEALDAAVTLYYVDYEFAYKSTRQFGTFYLDDKALADRIAIGGKVPIKFLSFDPTQSDVRMRSLKGMYK